jgi:MOSC domain-containing protein YiiM
MSLGRAVAGLKREETVDRGMTPIVAEVHRKAETTGEHGLPKPAVPSIRILANGVAGDFNRYRHEEKHDDPTSAVLLMPSETLEALRTEGWPVQPGDLGENLTTQGVPYEELRPGTVLLAGEAELEVTRPCDPCQNLYLLPYVGKTRGPSFLRTMVDRRGWYCRVRVPGTVRAGDPLKIVHPAARG